VHNRVFLVVALVCVTAPLSAEIGAPTDVAVRAKGAARIVVAQVTDVHSRFETNRPSPCATVNRYLKNTFQFENLRLLDWPTATRRFERPRKWWRARCS